GVEISSLACDSCPGYRDTPVLVNRQAAVEPPVDLDSAKTNIPIALSGVRVPRREECPGVEDRKEDLAPPRQLPYVQVSPDFEGRNRSVCSLPGWGHPHYPHEGCDGNLHLILVQVCETVREPPEL